MGGLLGLHRLSTVHAGFYREMPGDRARRRKDELLRRPVQRTTEVFTSELRAVVVTGFSRAIFHSGASEWLGRKRGSAGFSEAVYHRELRSRTRCDRGEISGRTECDRRDRRAVICSINPHLRACRARAQASARWSPPAAGCGSPRKLPRCLPPCRLAPARPS
jgi:hypothetical protein